MTNDTIAAIRTVGGRELPVAGTWTIDPAHTSLEFVARHMMVTKVRGRFTDVSGTIEVGEDPTDTKVSVDIDVATVSTGAEDRDGHLRSADFLDVEQYPEMTFRSTGIDTRGSTWKLQGDLTVHGVTKPVTLDVEYHGVTTDPWGAAKAQFSATGEIEREAFGLTWNVALESGGVLVSKKVKLEIEAQASLAA
jgi:polyisoprenoid-binding protein YceI